MMQWVERYASVPPMTFDQVLKATINLKDHYQAILEIIAQKQAGIETLTFTPPSNLQKFITDSLHNAAQSPPKFSPPKSQVNYRELFKTILQETWQDL